MIRTSFDPKITLRIVKKIPMFATLDEQELSSLLEKTNTYRCCKGEVLFLESDTAPHMYVILKGRVKVVETTKDGLERIMAFRQRGDYFGDMGLIDGKSDYATVISMDLCTLMLLTKDVFDEFFMENPKALRGLLAILSGRLRDSWLFQSIIGANDAESKVRVTLAHYGKTMGFPDSGGVIIDMVITQQGIADRVMITRETATRVLVKMRDNNEIENISGRRIKLLPAFYEKIVHCDLYKALSGMQNTQSTDDEAASAVHHRQW